jgi:hypothetical protein
MPPGNQKPKPKPQMPQGNQKPVKKKPKKPGSGTLVLQRKKPRP